MKILGIETSCDETSAAVLTISRGRFVIESNVVSSQIPIHRQFGGVVPEVAARNHILKVLPVINEALIKAKTPIKKIDRIAVTAGPGLISSLLIGAETAKALALALKKPIVPINHVQAHVHAAWLLNKQIRFPTLSLIVSGGHTELVLMKNAKHFKKIGATLDDASGEAFDKVAKMLNLGYPGGPAVAKHAMNGSATAFNFPRPMLQSDNLNFSFAGLKTSVLYTIQKIKVLDSKVTADLCASFQQAVVDVLIAKTMSAAKRHKVKTIILAGGVAANLSLRTALEKNVLSQSPKINFLVPPIGLCTDNAAMIAAAGFFGTPKPWNKIEVDPNWEIT